MMASVRRATTVLVLLLVAAASAAGSGTATSSAPVRVVDRTFSCAVAAAAGIRTIDVSAVSGYREPAAPAEWAWQPGAWVFDRAGSTLVTLTAGEQTVQADQHRVPMLAVTPTKCRPAKRIAFSRRDLTGGTASQLQGTDQYECRAGGGRVLVRVRAVFRAPTTFTRQRYQGRAILATPPEAVVREGKVAVRTLAGKPLMYADLRESGSARLFTAASCVSG
jgi:hypothetical protein